MPISIQQISYIHPDKEVLFSDLNFAISKGQKLGLVGNNGCGKSTLLQIIAGQLSPSSGVIVRPDDSDSQSDNEPSENNLPEQLLWQTPVSFQLKSGDRLRIEGTNGSGKTTLLKIITGQLQPQTGTLTRADFSYVYLNQEYSIIDDRNSVLEQVYAFNNRNLPEHEIKIILNRYLFPASEWDKSCRKLSGGEKMRLAFCCLMISNNTPDMFILDEPTNNLDIQSIDIITATIRNYTGTVIAISHDNYFIREIGIEQRIVLS